MDQGRGKKHLIFNSIKLISAQQLVILFKFRLI